MIFNDTIVVPAADAPPGAVPRQRTDGGPPTALVAASKTTAPYVIPAVLFQPHIQRRLCWNDHHHDTEHQ